MKNVISYILSFTIVLLTISIIAITFLNNKVLNEEYWKEKVAKSGYYEKLEATMNDGFENYIMQSGMDSSVFEGIYDLSKIKKDTNAIIHAILNNESYKIDCDDVREKLDSNIRNYIKNNKIFVNKTVENQIQNFEDSIINTYSNIATYPNSAIQGISTVISRVKVIIPNIFITIVVLLFASIIAIIMLNIKNAGNILKMMAIIAFSLAGLSLIGVILEKHFLGIQNLTVLNENISILVKIFVDEIYKILYITTSCGIIFGILLSAAECNIKQISKK